MENNSEVSHDGHRQRMIQRFLDFGFDAFSDYEVLEFLLFFSRPRHNTNDLAHRLLDKFGSLYNVVTADIQRLLQVDGVGKSTATFLKFEGEFIVRCLKSKTSSHPKLQTLTEVGNYLIELFDNIKHERICALMFDGDMRLTKLVTISEGCYNSAPIDPAAVARIAVLENASTVILAHNHPDGSPLPSRSDHRVTDAVEAALLAVNVPLLEHIIVGNGKFVGTMQARFHLAGTVKYNSRLNESFFNKFYHK